MTPPVPSVLAPPTHHPIELLDQLLGTLLLTLSLSFLVLLELTRRRVLSLHQFTFCLASAVATLTIGAFIEHNVPNEVLDVALFGYYTQASTVLHLRYAPLAAAAAATVAFLVYISLCSCSCCCLCAAPSSDDAAPDAPEDASHQRCVLARLRHSVSVYLLVVFALFLALGMRLNARMRLSAIKPVGGTLHWQLLQTPICVSALHIASLALVVLKDILQHAEASPAIACEPRSTRTPSLSRDLMRPNSPTSTPRDSSGVQLVSVHPQSPSKRSSSHQTIQNKQQGALAHSLRRLPSKSSPSLARATVASSDDDTISKNSTSSLVDEDPSLPSSSSSFLRRTSSPRSSKSSLVQRVSPVRRRAATEGESTPASFLTRRHATPVGQPAPRLSPPTIEGSSGDISNLISSESESDDDVIVPSAVRQFTSDYAMVNRLVASSNDRSATQHEANAESDGDRPYAPPAGSPWVLCYDEATSAPYYYCHDTGESKWELPDAPAHAKWE